MHLDLAIEGLNHPVSMEVHDRPDLVSAELINSGIWEKFETQLFIEHIEPDSVFVDVGANIGYYSTIAGELIGEQGAIISFEPEADNFRLLQKNTDASKCPHIKLINAALSNSNKTGQLYMSDDNLGDHRLYAGGERPSQPVRLLRGDDFFSGQRIDFLKVDTQGAEYQVIDGLRNTIQNNVDHLKIVLEFWPWGLVEAGNSARDLVELIRPFGLTSYVIDHVNHKLLPTHCDELLETSETTLLPEHQGFINLFLTG